MTGRRAALGVGAALVVAALSGPALASWAVGASGSAAAYASALGTPQGLAVSDVTATGLRLSWTAPSGPAPDAYVVHRDGTAITSCASVTATSCTDSGLEPGTPYTYTVTAALRSWRGSASAPVSATTDAPVPAGAAPQTVAPVGCRTTAEGAQQTHPVRASSSVDTSRSTRTACSSRRSWVTSSSVPV